MSRHPIVIALDELDNEPSAEFAEAMHDRLLAALVQSSQSADTSMADEQRIAVDVEVQTADEGTPRKVRAFEPRSKRAGSFLAAVAAIVLVAALVVAVMTRRDEPVTNGADSDREIAASALIEVADLGPTWEHSHLFDRFSTRDQAGVAANVPGCSLYVNSVFDGPERQAATSQEAYRNREAFGVLREVVSVFPSKAAASRVMDKIAEPAFSACFAGYLEAAAPVVSSGDTFTSHVIDAPPLRQHGERQIAFETVNYSTVGAPVPITSVNVFIQVDRAIVYLNPAVDSHDSLGPAGPLEMVLSAATESLTTALSQSPGN